MSLPDTIEEIGFLNEKYTQFDFAPLGKYLTCTFFIEYELNSPQVKLKLNPSFLSDF